MASRVGTATSGRPRARAMPLARLKPTRRPVYEPGPAETAIASRSAGGDPRALPEAHGRREHLRRLLARPPASSPRPARPVPRTRATPPLVEAVSRASTRGSAPLRRRAARHRSSRPARPRRPRSRGAAARARKVGRRARARWRRSEIRRSVAAPSAWREPHRRGGRGAAGPGPAAAHSTTATPSPPRYSSRPITPASASRPRPRREAVEVDVVEGRPPGGTRGSG